MLIYPNINYLQTKTKIHKPDNQKMIANRSTKQGTVYKRAYCSLPVKLKVKSAPLIDRTFKSNLSLFVTSARHNVF